jgi:hypothetical protein
MLKTVATFLATDDMIEVEMIDGLAGYRLIQQQQQKRSRRSEIKNKNYML